MRLSAFLAPDAIPFELLSRGAPELGPEVGAVLRQADDAPLVVNDLLQPLGRFSLIRIDGEVESYSIHRLVQEVLKAAMDDPTRRLWAERAVRAVNRAFPTVEYANWPLCGRLLPHALAIASWIERDGMVFQEADSFSIKQHVIFTIEVNMGRPNRSSSGRWRSTARPRARGIPSTPTR